MSRPAAFADDDDEVDNSAVSLIDGDLTGSHYCWPGAVAICDFLSSQAQLITGQDVVELGAGLGLCGLYCHFALQPKSVLLTDGSTAALARLVVNAASNPCKQGISATVARLQWAADDVATLLHGTPAPNTVLAADLAYPCKDTGPLLSALKAFLCANSSTKIVMAYGWRDRGHGLSFRAQLDKFSRCEEVSRSEGASSAGGSWVVPISIYILQRYQT